MESTKRQSSNSSCQFCISTATDVFSNSVHASGFDWRLFCSRQSQLTDCAQISHSQVLCSCTMYILVHAKGGRSFSRILHWCSTLYVVFCLRPKLCFFAKYTWPNGRCVLRCVEMFLLPPSALTGKRWLIDPNVSAQDSRPIG